MRAAVSSRGWSCVFISAALVLTAGVPFSAFAGMGGNDPPVIDSLSVAQNAVIAGGDVTLTCAGHDLDGTVVSYRWTCSDGALALGGCDAQQDPTGGAVSTTWTAPTTLGVYIIGCSASDNGGAFGGTSSSPESTIEIEVVADYTGPRIDSLAAASTDVMVSTVVALTATYSDPDNSALQVSWTSTAGAITGAADATPGEVTWLTPATAQWAVITLTVTDGDGYTATSSIAAAVHLAVPSGCITNAVDSPGRLSSAGNDLLVLDVRRRELMLFTPAGQHKLGVFTVGLPQAAAADDDGFIVAVQGEGKIRSFDRFGRRQANFANGREFSHVSDIKRDPVTGGFFVTDDAAAKVTLLDRLGEVTLEITECAPGAALSRPVAATRMPDGDIQVVRQGISTSSQLCVYDSTGIYRTERIGLGAGIGAVTQAVEVIPWLGADTIILDVYRAEAHVFGPAGEDRGSIGSYGRLPGQVRRPAGMVTDSFGRLFVSSADNRRIERFNGPGAVQPYVPNDADFDGLPDDWEVAQGLDPLDPTDYAADFDNDDLKNLEEQEIGTDPKLADTDGDGWTDGREWTAGTNPLDPADHSPMVLTDIADRMPPSLVRLDGAATTDPDGDPLTYAWTQLEGAPVQLLDTDTAVARFVGRTAGVYAFAFDVSDGYSTASTTVLLEILNVPPAADPGALVVGSTEQPMNVRGSLTTDANFDPITLQWAQIDGTRLEADSWAGESLTFSAPDPGVRALVLSAYDGTSWGERAVDVVVSSPRAHIPNAVISVLGERRVGRPLTLDATASSDADGKPETLRVQWAVLEGTLALDDPSAATLQIQPTHPGLHRFSLMVTDSHGLQSPVVEIDIAIAARDSEVPIARMTGPRVVTLLDSVVLSGESSTDADGDTLTYAWTQTGGPFMAVPANDGSTLALTPIDAGTYTFELRVSDAIHESLADVHELTVVADYPSSAPTAVTPPSLTLKPAEPLILDASDSWDGQDDALNYRWTQTAGAWLALLDGAEPIARVESVPEGEYRFAVYVDDGTLRSEPAFVDVTVATPTSPDANDGVDDSKDGHGISGAGGCSSTGGSFGLALCMLMVLMLGRRRQRILLVFVALLAPGVASAFTPHDGPSTDCTSCHVPHNAAGGTLTNQEGNPNLCLSCHVVASTHLRAYLEIDQADLFGRRGTHHRWDSGVAGYDVQMTSLGSTGSVVPRGDYSGAGKKYYEILFTASGSESAATYDWQRYDADGTPETSGSTTCGVDVLLDAGVTMSCRAESSGALGSCSQYFCINEVYRLYVTDVPVTPAGPNSAALLGGSGDRMPDGKAVCSTCHDQHDAVQPGYTSRMVAGELWEHYMRVDNRDAALCYECHVNRYSDPSACGGAHGWFDLTRCYTGQARSHPVSVALNENGAGYDRAEPLEADGQPQTPGDGIASNDLILDTSGRVTCLTCHSTHSGSADDNSKTDWQ